MYRAETSCPRPPRRGMHWPLAVVMLTAITLLTGLAALYLAPVLAARWRMIEDQMAADAVYLKRRAELKAEADAAADNLARLESRTQLVALGFREVARRVAPVVVNVSNEIEARAFDKGPTIYDFESQRDYVQQAEGSGLLVQPGRVLTNYHVVRNAHRLRITFPSGRRLLAVASQVAADPLTDLAVIRLTEEPGPAYKEDYAVVAEFADSDRDLQVGDWTLAVGSPFGLRQTITAGILSAKGRAEIGVLDQVELLQTDAAINPGNSGGPLFDQRGRVIGINVAIASHTGRNQGVGFAIPSNTVREVFEQLVTQGEVVRGFLGVGMREIPEDLEARLGIADTGGIIVSEVRRDSPAERADIRKGDVIVRYNQEPVGPRNALGRLRQLIARTPPDSAVPVELQRQGERLTVAVTIMKRPIDLPR